MSCAVTGVGRLTHLTAELLQSRTDTKLLTVPYTGGPAHAISDVVSGRVGLLIEGYSGIAGAVQSGSVKAIAVAFGGTSDRVPQCAHGSLPADLQQIVDKDAASESMAINPQAIEINDRARKAWMDGGGELISLPADEQSAMLKTLASVGEDVAKTKLQLSAAYQVVTQAAQNTR
jgi:hypothetical protein